MYDLNSHTGPTLEGPSVLSLMSCCHHLEILRGLIFHFVLDSANYVADCGREFSCLLQVPLIYVLYSFLNFFSLLFRIKEYFFFIVFAVKIQILESPRHGF